MANEWLNYFNFHKRRHVFSPLQQLIALGGNLTLHPPVHSKKGLPPTYSLSNEKIYMDTHLKEELTDFFLKLSGIPYSYRQSRESKLNTVHMVSIISKRQLRGHIYALDQFLSYARKEYFQRIYVVEFTKSLSENCQKNKKNCSLVK